MIWVQPHWYVTFKRMQKGEERSMREKNPNKVIWIPSKAHFHSQTSSQQANIHPTNLISRSCSDIKHSQYYIYDILYIYIHIAYININVRITSLIHSMQNHTAPYSIPWPNYMYLFSFIPLCSQSYIYRIQSFLFSREKTGPSHIWSLLLMLSLSLLMYNICAYI